MTNQEILIYQISTNPIIESNNTHLPINDIDNFAFGFVDDFSIITGMMNSLDKTIAAIKKSSLIYMTGELDQTSYFELGLAISLGKKVYYVTEKTYDILDFGLPYSVENLIPINYEAFIKLVDEI